MNNSSSKYDQSWGWPSCTCCANIFRGTANPLASCNRPWKDRLKRMVHVQYLKHCSLYKLSPLSSLRVCKCDTTLPLLSLTSLRIHSPFHSEINWQDSSVIAVCSTIMIHRDLSHVLLNLTLVILWLHVSLPSARVSIRLCSPGHQHTCSDII